MKWAEKILEWQKIQNKALKQWIKLSDHAAKRIINRFWRWISYEKVVDVYRNWTKYLNPQKKQYVLIKIRATESTFRDFSVLYFNSKKRMPLFE